MIEIRCDCDSADKHFPSADEISLSARARKISCECRFGHRFWKRPHHVSNLMVFHERQDHFSARAAPHYEAAEGLKITQVPYRDINTSAVDLGEGRLDIVM